jgi:SAM-dependent methyltransferase
MNTATNASQPSDVGIQSGLADNPFLLHKGGSALVAGELNAWKFAPYVRSTDTVLEWGCPGGYLLKAMPGTGKAGIEEDPQARALCKALGLDVFASVADAQGHKYSRIISNHHLEHQPYPIESLRELQSLLTDDGKLVLCIPIDDWRVERDWQKDIDGHLHTWTPPLLANTLRKAGYEVELVTVLTHAWPKFWDKLWPALPEPIFHMLARLYAAMLNRRQLIAVARKASRG